MRKQNIINAIIIVVYTALSLVPSMFFTFLFVFAIAFNPESSTVKSDVSDTVVVILIAALYIFILWFVQGKARNDYAKAFKIARKATMLAQAIPLFICLHAIWTINDNPYSEEFDKPEYRYHLKITNARGASVGVPVFLHNDSISVVDDIQIYGENNDFVLLSFSSPKKINRMATFNISWDAQSIKITDRLMSNNFDLFYKDGDTISQYPYVPVENIQPQLTIDSIQNQALKDSLTANNWSITSIWHYTNNQTIVGDFIFIDINFRQNNSLVMYGDTSYYGSLDTVAIAKFEICAPFIHITSCSDTTLIRQNHYYLCSFPRAFHLDLSLVTHLPSMGLCLSDINKYGAMFDESGKLKEN